MSRIVTPRLERDSAVNKIICGIALLLGTSVAAWGAGLPGNGRNRLLTVSEWNGLCERLVVQAKVASCITSIHRATVNGRTMGPFELVRPKDSSLLQSRSGVLLNNQLNELIVRVNEDSGMRTSVRLQDDTQCQAYAATSDLVGVPRSDRSYAGLVHSWLDVYTDDTILKRHVSIGMQNSNQTIEFEALTDGDRLIRGKYLVDERQNAAVFATCDHPRGSNSASRNAELFFNSIVGSVRRFI